MKSSTSVKVTKLYSFHDIVEDDLKKVIRALEHYKQSFPYLDNDQNNVDELIKGFKSAHTFDLENQPELLIQNTKLSNKLSTSEDVLKLLKRMRPFDFLLIPSEFISDDLCGKNVVQFLAGKSGQFSLSLWDNKHDFKEEKPAKSILWLNKYCARNLRHFLDTDGERIVGYAQSIVRGKSQNTFSVYVDNKGSHSYDKSILFIYNKVTKSVLVKKEDVSISLNYIETLCLKEFLDSHFE